jgi:hypothetical protein
VNTCFHVVASSTVPLGTLTKASLYYSTARLLLLLLLSVRLVAHGGGGCHSVATIERSPAGSVW